jgi:GntR family transcriptional regulator
MPRDHPGSNMNRQPSSAVPLGSPLYEQIKQAILGALAHGEWKQGEAIPPEKVLAERFGVSIGTLRKAVDELAAENILIRHQGRGTYVAVHTRNSHFFKFFRIVRQDGDKSYPTTELMRFRRVRASALVREKLGLPAASHVFEFSNVLSLHGAVVMVDEPCFPA